MKTLFCLLTPLLLMAPRYGDIVVKTPERTYIAKKLVIKEVVGELAVELEDGSGKSHVLKCMDVEDISMAALAPAKTAGAVDVQVSLWTGDTVLGTLGDIDPKGESVLLKSAALGEIAFKFEHIDSVRFLANRAVWPKKRPDDLKNDLVLTKSSDSRSGTMISLSKLGVTYQSRIKDAAGKFKELTIKAEDCAVVYLTEPPGAKPAAPAGLFAIVQLTDGTALQGTIQSMAEGVLNFTDLMANARKVGTGAIAGLYFKNGRVVYLSDMQHARADEQAMYIRDPDPKKRYPSDIVAPFQRDKNAHTGVKETKLSIRQQEFRKGIGVHARSEIEFSLAAGFKKFEALVGIDDCVYAPDLSGSPCGNVIFQVLADGKKLWDSGNVTFKDAARPVSLSVEGVKSLVLLVDWGEDGSQGDYADWALARVIR